LSILDNTSSRTSSLFPNIKLTLTLAFLILALAFSMISSLHSIVKTFLKFLA